MTPSRVPIIAAAFVAGALVGQLLLELFSDLVSFFGVPSLGPVGELYRGVVAEFVAGIVQAAAFGVGLVIAFIFVTRVDAGDNWRRVIRTAILATLTAIGIYLVIGVVLTVIQSTDPGAYPFGYAFTPAFDSNLAGVDLLRLLATLPARIVEWFALVLVATAGQKLWLAGHPTAVPVDKETFAPTVQVER